MPGAVSKDVVVSCRRLVAKITGLCMSHHLTSGPGVIHVAMFTGVPSAARES